MAEPKTKKTRASVKGFLARVADARRRDAEALCALMARLSGEPPAMWGPSIIGFGAHPWPTADGRATPWPIVAFAPRREALVLYLLPEFAGREALLAKLGKHRAGKSCVYVKRLDDVDPAVLERLVRKSIAATLARKPAAASRRGAGRRGVSARVRGSVRAARSRS